LLSQYYLCLATQFLKKSEDAQKTLVTSYPNVLTLRRHKIF